MAMSRLLSVSTLPTFTFPAYALASLSIVGASIRQGMHHSAQKSTSTGVSARRTSASKFSSLNSFTFSLAIMRLLQTLRCGILEVGFGAVNLPPHQPHVNGSDDKG